MEEVQFHQKQDLEPYFAQIAELVSFVPFSSASIMHGRRKKE